MVFASKIYVFLFIFSSWSSSFVLIPHYQCRLVRYRIQALKFGHKNWHWQSWHIFQHKKHMKISWHTTSGIQGQQYYAPNIQLNDFFMFCCTKYSDWKTECNFSQTAQNIILLTFSYMQDQKNYFKIWQDAPRSKIKYKEMFENFWIKKSKGCLGMWVHSDKTFF